MQAYEIFSIKACILSEANHNCFYYAIPNQAAHDLLWLLEDQNVIGQFLILYKKSTFTCKVLFSIRISKQSLN